MRNVINMALIREPMNWGVVFVAASVWLLVFHTLMQAFNAMSNGAGAPAAPGVAAQANIAPAMVPIGTTGLWTDGMEANYAEDGWTPG